MLKRGLSIILLMVVMLQSTMITGFAYTPSMDAKCNTAVSQAVQYLKSVQNDDGGFPMQEGMESSVIMTSWAVMALAAAGEEVSTSTWKKSGNTPIAFMKSSDEEVDSTVNYARLLMALTAAKANLSYKGENMLDKVLLTQQRNGAFYRPEWGEEGMVYAHMWSILAIASTGEPIPNKEKAKAYLLAQQNPDGGFPWFEEDVSDTGDTSIAIQALLVLGEDPKSKAIEKALGYIKSMQKEDGGFCAGESMGTESTSSSDALGLQALTAVRMNPLDTHWQFNGKNTLEHLLANQADDGSFYWKHKIASSTVKMTSTAIMALNEKPHPVAIEVSDYHYRNKVSFSDLAKSHWAYDEITSLVGSGIISGYPDATFKPENLVSRAEFTRFLVYGLDAQNRSYSNSMSFKDVSRSHWAYALIRIGVNQNFISGRSAESFDPNGKISGAELACMLIRARYQGNTSWVKKGSEWYSAYVDLATDQGLMYPGFSPDAQVTRAQCAYSIDKLRALLN